MGVLFNLTKEYFGETERMEDNIELPEGVVRVSFTDNNGVIHRNGYRVESGNTRILRKLIERLIEKRGLEADFNDIDVSNIKDMSFLFKGVTERGEETIFTDFNGDISGWDVSSVTNMDSMFHAAKHFNKPIGKWDVSNVTDMCMMFCATYDFDQPIGNWDVGKVTNMEDMFRATRSFNQPIGKWKIGSRLKKDEKINMCGIFRWATKFNKPIGDWDVSKVAIMKDMFYFSDSFNKPIGKWDVSNVTDMCTMFSGAIKFNQDISNWDVKKVEDYFNIFHNCPIKDKYKPKKFKK